MSSSPSRLLKHYSQSRAGHEKILMTWSDIEYSILTKDPKESKAFRAVMKSKTIISSMSGSAESGELLAIMGPTGCGKTSLLNILAGRVSDVAKKNSKLVGNIFINGKARNDDGFRRISAYVLQDDRMYAHLTVFETLILAAHFYLPDTFTTEAKVELVNDVIDELGLGKTRDTIIGDEKKRGISGGERKRANIAAQLISDPAVLFLDEPTSGLDSFQALAVMDSMKTLAANGRLVVTVIHQPRSSIYDMFDKLLLLSESHAIYLGPARDACAYFEGMGHVCPQFFNPADFFLDILSPDVRTPEREQTTQKRIADFAEVWLSAAAQRNIRTNSEIQKDATLGEIKQIGTFSAGKFSRNILLLGWRSFSEQRRNIGAIMFKTIMSIIFACIIGGIYSGNSNDLSSIRNKQGLLFIITINQTFNNAIGVFNVFPNEKTIVNRERAAHAYDTMSYFFSKFVAELPLNVIPSVIYGSIVYWIGGLNPSAFGLFLLIIMLHAVTAITMGLAVSAVAPTPEAASAMGVPLIIIPLIFAGFYINLNSLPIVADLLPYVSLMKWTFEALCINQFSGEKYCTGSRCQTGSEILDRLAFGDDTVSYCIMGLSLLLIGYFIMAVFFLHRSKAHFMALGTVGGGMVTFERNSERAAAISSSNSAPKTFPASNSNDAAEPLKAVDVEHNASEGD